MAATMNNMPITSPATYGRNKNMVEYAASTYIAATMCAIPAPIIVAATANASFYTYM